MIISIIDITTMGGRNFVPTTDNETNYDTPKTTNVVLSRPTCCRVTLTADDDVITEYHKSITLYVTITGYGYYRVVDVIGVSQKTETMDIIDYVIFISSFYKINIAITRLLS